MPYIDMTGKRFGKLTVLYHVENDRFNNAQWMCKCDCGKEKVIVGSALRKGIIVSCGCFHRFEVSKRLTTHGQSSTRLFHIWQCMKSRCNNPHHKNYNYYGGKGIKVCQEWEHDFSRFAEWANNNGYADGLTIDRIDSSKGYEPSNCKWSTRKEQQSHLSSSIHTYEINGEIHTLAQWCRIYNVPYEKTRRRILNGHHDILSALTVPSFK